MIDVPISEIRIGGQQLIGDNGRLNPNFVPQHLHNGNEIINNNFSNTPVTCLKANVLNKFGDIIINDGKIESNELNIELFTSVLACIEIFKSLGISEDKFKEYYEKAAKSIEEKRIALQVRDKLIGK